jgi:hypothetical protein
MLPTATQLADDSQDTPHSSRGSAGTADANGAADLACAVAADAAVAAVDAVDAEAAMASTAASVMNLDTRLTLSTTRLLAFDDREYAVNARWRDDEQMSNYAAHGQG